MTDELIIQEAIRLVDEGMSVTLPVKGQSMLPFIIGGKESVILAKPEALQKGDVVLADVGGRYVVHRIISLDEHQVVLMGDGNIIGTEQCPPEGVKAKATHVVDAKHRQHPLYTPWRQRAAKWWWHLHPIRRYILAIYRRL